MTNLIPEKHMDKNGRLVTKHVRTGEPVTPPPVLPKVSVYAQKMKRVDKTLEKRIRRLDSRILFNFDASKFEPPSSEILKPILHDVYHPGCTHNDFYDMLERLPLSETIVLLSYSLRASHLDVFVKKNKFESYLVDNSELVEKLRERGITAPVYFKLATSDEGRTASIDALVDAAECSELIPGKTFDGMFEASQLYPKYLLAGQIKLDDIKAIGIERCKDTNVFRGILLRLAKGESRATAQEIGGMLNRTEVSDRKYTMNGATSTNAGTRAYLAMILGVELAESVRNPKAVEAAYEVSNEHKLSLEETISFCRFTNNLIEEDDHTSDSFLLPGYMFFDLWKAGVPAELTKDGLDKNLTTGQIIAIHTEDIEPSVSSGWL